LGALYKAQLGPVVSDGVNTNKPFAKQQFNTMRSLPAAQLAAPKLSISTQQSRYAIDCLDAPTTKEVLIKDLSISIGHRELLSRTVVHLVEGRKYVLIGRNGEGKSIE
jgi:ABC-type molybdenum transport system ATPase subunit/photorepair protein PhrA